jgi:hypothetical protein
VATLKQIARAIEKCPDEACADMVAWFLPEATRRGGRIRFAGGKAYKMGARVKSRKSGRVWMEGTPAGGWAIKSYGRRGGFDVKARHGRAVTVGPNVYARVRVGRSTSGDNRWTELVNDAERKFPDVFLARVKRAVR